MKTQLTATESLYQHLRNNNARELIGINGNIYKLNRPFNGILEDIVIVPLAMNADDVQEGVLNINLHVPNLDLENDKTQPALLRMGVLEYKLMPLLENVWGYDYNFKIDQPGQPVRGDNDWFLNIRIRFYTIKN